MCSNRPELVVHTKLCLIRRANLSPSLLRIAKWHFRETNFVARVACLRLGLAGFTASIPRASPVA